MSESPSPALAAQVRQRAADRCEYCRMHQSLQGATFHVEHVRPRSRGGATTLGNLAWCCPGCNLRKSDRIAISLGSGGETRLFNPRQDAWADHFAFEGFVVLARTKVGEATISALDLNHSRRVRVREAESRFGLFPSLSRPPR